MPYNFENISIPEVSDFSESLTNYAKTVEKTSIYDSSDLQKENGKIENLLRDPQDSKIRFKKETYLYE